MADEWEESIVYVELCGVSSSQLFPEEGSSNQAEILGLASQRPLMQINGHTFAGHYEDTVGTHLFMANDKKNLTAGGDGHGSRSTTQSVNWHYLSKTDKKLVMQPAFLVDKATPSSAAGAAADASVKPAAETGTPAAEGSGQAAT